MKPLAKVVLCLLVLHLCCGFVHAEDLLTDQAELFGAEALPDALPEDAQDLMDEFSPTKSIDLLVGLRTIMYEIAEDTVGALYDSAVFAARLFLTVAVCQMVCLWCEKKGSAAALYAGALSIMVVCLENLQTMVGVGTGAMSELTDFSMMLNPVMAAASAASGSVSGAGVNYSLSVFFSNILLQLCNRIIVPIVYAYLALALTDTLLQQERLKRLRELLGWGTELTLKIIVYAFTGCLTVTGVLSGSADAAKLKAAKLTISGMIPVVGGIISGAAETVLSGAAFLKNTIGTFGMLAVIAIFLLPFLKLTVSWFCLRIAAALSGLLVSPLTGLLEAVAKAMGYLVAMTGSCALICILSCCCYLKVVHV